MYFENTNYAISHSWYDSKRAIIQLGKLPQCTKAGTAPHSTTNPTFTDLKPKLGQSNSPHSEEQSLDWHKHIHQSDQSHVIPVCICRQGEREALAHFPRCVTNLL